MGSNCIYTPTLLKLHITIWLHKKEWYSISLTNRLKIYFLKIPMHSIDKQKNKRLEWTFIWNWVTWIYKEQKWMWLEQMQHGELMTKDNFFIYEMFNIMNIRQKWASSIMQKMMHWMSKCEPWIMKSLIFLAR